MNFQNSNIILHLVWIAPFVVILDYFGYRQRRKKITLFINNRDLAHELTTNVSIVKRRCRDILFISALVCIVIALAGPRWGTKLVKRPSHSRDLLVILDCSRSMLAD